MLKFDAILALVFLLAKNGPGAVQPESKMVEEIAKSIIYVAVEEWEIETMTRTAWWESRYSRNVVQCTIVNSFGARGAWQVVPRTHSEALDACSSSMDIQARLALSRMRESRTWCEKLGFRGSDVMSAYTTGKCIHGEPNARVRWGDGSAIRMLVNNDKSK